jgi:hypothetical protein
MLRTMSAQGEKQIMTCKSRWVVLAMLLDLDNLEETMRSRLKSICRRELHNIFVDCVGCPALLEKVRGIVEFTIASDEEQSVFDDVQTSISINDTVLDAILSWR